MTRKLLAVPVVLLRRDAARNAELLVLRHENAADDNQVMRTAPRAPRMNAHCERVIGTLRRDGLDHLLILNETHARQVLDACAQHYNSHRPHQACGQLPPLA